MILAVDVGGTKTLTALVTARGEVVRTDTIPTPTAEGGQAVVASLIEAIRKIAGKTGGESDGVEYVVIAAAGAIDSRAGVMTASPNIPGWDDLPLRDIVQDRVHLNTYLINDANSAALGEFVFGAGRGTRDMIYVTVSTGIGGGIIIDGKLYEGADGSAGEVGHMTIDINGPPCTCGSNGCLEALASGTAIAREAVRRIVAGERSGLRAMVGGDIERITAEQVHLAAKEGDILAKMVFLQAANCLGVGMANLANIFNPERIVVGGGVAEAGEDLLSPVRKVVSQRAMKLPGSRVDIVRGKLGKNAGVIGAAAFVRELSRERKMAR